MTDKKRPNKPGPKPETVNAEGTDWKDALKHALQKPKPKEGWPKGGKGKKGEGKPKDKGQQG